MTESHAALSRSAERPPNPRPPATWQSNDPTERTLLGALQNPKFNIAGVRRADLSPLLQQLSPSALSRQIRRLRHLGLIKRVAKTYRYYLTRAGRAVIAAASHITEYGVVPALA